MENAKEEKVQEAGNLYLFARFFLLQQTQYDAGDKWGRGRKQGEGLPDAAPQIDAAALSLQMGNCQVIGKIFAWIRSCVRLCWGGCCTLDRYTQTEWLAW